MTRARMFSLSRTFGRVLVCGAALSGCAARPPMSMEPGVDVISSGDEWLDTVPSPSRLERAARRVQGAAAATASGARQIATGTGRFVVAHSQDVAHHVSAIAHARTAAEAARSSDADASPARTGTPDSSVVWEAMVSLPASEVTGRATASPSAYRVEVLPASVEIGARHARRVPLRDGAVHYVAPTVRVRSLALTKACASDADALIQLVVRLEASATRSVRMTPAFRADRPLCEATRDAALRSAGAAVVTLAMALNRGGGASLSATDLSAHLARVHAPTTAHPRAFDAAVRRQIGPMRRLSARDSLPAPVSLPPR